MLPELGEGEREAIVLAQELGAVLLIDEPRGRNEARKFNLRWLSTIGILRQAKREGLTPEIKGSLDQIIKSGFRIKKELYQEILLEEGELDKKEFI